MGDRRFLLVSLAVLCFTAAAAFGQAPQQDAGTPANPPPASSPGAAPNPFAMDLDALFNTKVTTASKFSEELADAPSSMSVVTRDELSRFGAITLLEVLERVAGLTGSSAVLADRGIVAVRGDQTRPDEGHVLLLINGRPVREIMDGGFSSDILQSFPVNLIDRIEVIKGPGSVLYGSDAYSGVINIITQKAAGKSFHASGAGGGAAEATGSEEILYARGDFNLVEGAQYQRMPAWETLFRSFPVRSNLVYSQNATLRDDGEGVYLGAGYKGLSFSSAYTAVANDSLLRGIVGDTHLRRGFGDLGYDLPASSKWDMKFDFTFTRTLLDDAPDFPDIHQDGNEADFEWTNFITFSERDRLTFGAVVTRIDGKEFAYGQSPTFIDVDTKRWGNAFYAQYEHRLTADLKLIGGVQANKIGNLHWDAVPRAVILWHPALHWTLKALYGGAFHAPSLDETGIDQPAIKGDPTLVPEKVRTLDLQASYQSNRLQASADYFNSQESHLIFLDGSTFPALYYNLSTPAHFQGVDSEAKYYLKRDWFLMASVLYQVNHDQAVTYLSPIPSLGAKAGVSYKARNGAELSVFDAYQGHIGGYASAVNPEPDAFHSVSAQARFDLSKHWFKNGAQGYALFVHGDDLTNTPIWLPAQGSNSPNTIPVIRGRTIYFGIEVWQKQ